MAFRPTTEKDIEAISDLAYRSFMEGYYTNVGEKELRNGTQNYVISELLICTFSEVYEEDGEVLGFVIGMVKGRPRIFSDLKKYRKANSRLFAKIGSDIDDCNRRMYDAYGRDMDCEGLLFAMDPRCRGKGIGTELFKHMLDYFREEGYDCMYLFTGDNCTMGYYDHNGYEMAGKEMLDIGFRTRDSRMYCKKLDG